MPTRTKQTKRPDADTARQRVTSVTNILEAANYHPIADIKGPKPSGGTMRFYAGPGQQSLIILQEYANGSGIELWTPLTTSTHMGAVLETLNNATERRSIVDQAVTEMMPSQARQHATEKHYSVTWQIDADASTPEDAAREAFKHMQRHGTTANVFDVIDEEGNTTRVDLEQLQQDAPSVQDLDAVTCECGLDAPSVADLAPHWQASGHTRCWVKMNSSPRRRKEDQPGTARTYFTKADECVRLCEALAAFWGDGVCDAPIWPGAYLTEEETPIRDLVRAAVGWRKP